jgi:hypothetical protein
MMISLNGDLFTVYAAFNVPLEVFTYTYIYTKISPPDNCLECSS